jgi:hypothetical protein
MSKEHGIFDQMLVKMDEKKNLYNQERQATERRHLENIFKAQEQANLIASTTNLGIDDLNDVIKNEQFSAGVYSAPNIEVS